MSNNFVEQYVLRCEAYLYEFDKPFKQINGSAPRVPAGNDAVLQVLFKKTFSDGTVNVADVSTIESITAEIQAATRAGAPFTRITLGSGELDNTADAASWANGTKQHVSIPFSPADLELAASKEGTEYYLVLSATLSNGKTLTAAQTQFFIIKDNIGTGDSIPVQAGNLVAENATYDENGEYEIEGLAPGRGLRWTQGANDTNVENGNETISTNNAMFFVQGTSILLTGTPNEPVTAIVWNVVFLRLDEADAIFARKIPAGANYRFKDGQLQFWDATAHAADNTKPWRALGVDNGVTVWSDPIND